MRGGKMQNLSKAKLAELQECYNDYYTYKNIVLVALANSQHKPEDINSWIRSNNGHSEEALTILMKAESNKTAKYYSDLISDIDNAIKRLEAIDFERQTDYAIIAKKYFKGAEYHKVKDLVDLCKNEGIYYSPSGMYKARYRILEALAKEQGVLL
jgi:hypothetical protein